MTRVHIICEGQTEEMFVAEIMAPVFMTRQIYLTPSLIGKPGHKGGNFKFPRLFTDVRARLADKTAYCTTFFDFYGLPEAFPGKAEAHTKNGIANKATHIRQALTARLAQELGTTQLQRFIPYIQMYEFEGLLFSAPEKLAMVCNQMGIAQPLQQIRNEFNTPEEINNSPLTAPSKRILQLFKGYDKPVHGALAALEIGLDNIRKECALFNEWLLTLEALPPLK